jgi:hypothetical protein
MPSLREKFLMFVEELVDLHLRNLHICITSRSEVDITIALNSLHSHTVDLRERGGWTKAGYHQLCQLGR